MAIKTTHCRPKENCVHILKHLQKCNQSFIRKIVMTVYNEETNNGFEHTIAYFKLVKSSLQP